jgi:hypothetical protein
MSSSVPTSTIPATSSRSLRRRQRWQGRRDREADTSLGRSRCHAAVHVGHQRATSPQRQRRVSVLGAIKAGAQFRPRFDGAGRRAVSTGPPDTIARVFRYPDGLRAARTAIPRLGRAATGPGGMPDVQLSAPVVSRTARAACITAVEFAELLVGHGAACVVAPTWPNAPRPRTTVGTSAAIGGS